MSARTRRIEDRIRLALESEDPRFDVEAWERDPGVFFHRIRKPTETLRNTILRYWDHAQKKPVADLLRLSNLSESDFADPMIEYVAFNVFGCPWSTDIDVVCQLTSRIAVVDDVPINLERLRRELAAIGYDVSGRSLDVNLVFVDDEGKIRQSSVGCSNETQNILRATYDYHAQAYPCMVRGDQESDLDDRLRVLAKCILDNMELLMDDVTYQSLREQRRAAYQDSLPSRLALALDWLQLVRTIPATEVRRTKFNTVIKSITMKLIQAWIYPRRIYTKVKLAHAVASRFPELEAITLCALTRGVHGTHSFDTAQWRNLCDMLRTHDLNATLKIHFDTSPITWVDTTFPPPSTWVEYVQQFSTCPDELVAMIAHSPTKMPDDFPALLCRLAPIDRYETINDWFPIPTTPEWAEVLPVSDLQCTVLPMTQRSVEWRQLHITRGAIPMDQANVSDEQWYAIVRGAILEGIATANVDFGVDTRRISVGFLESKQSPLCAPDLLLVSHTGTVIPVEVKVIAAEPPLLTVQRLHDWPRSTQRAVKLARKQLGNAATLLYGSITSTTGVLCFVYTWTSTSGENEIACRLAAIASI